MKVKIIVALIVLSFFTFGLGISYMYFNTSKDSFFDQKIANFVFKSEEKDKIELPLSDLKPGDVKSFDFSVTNADQEKISGVNIDYKIILKTYHFAPLKIELYNTNDNANELILNCDETYSRNNDNQIVCNTPVQELKHTQEKIDNYKLKVTFPQEYNGTEYANLVDFIDLEIVSNQKL